SFAILTGSNPETAVAIAIPIAVLGQLLGVTFRTIIAALGHRADAAIEKGNFREATNYHIVWGTILYSTMYFIPVFLAIYLGTDFVQGIVDAVPEWFTNGLNFAAKLLTAYGLSLLLSMMASKGMMVFFFLGFFGCAYLGLDVTAISIFGVLLALILMSIKFPGGATSAAAAGVDDDYDPLEDDEL
ncbi:MAG: PTS sugar transporter subunit IIC, partial [Atopobiaceae bacterium]|nr:PTS sugar transporter subunit IIC [Atopobiaceae bacterium]